MELVRRTHSSIYLYLYVLDIVEVKFQGYGRLNIGFYINGDY